MDPQQIPHLFFKIPFCGYSCAFSPFDGSKLAVSAAQHFGIVGNGCLHILELQPGGLVQTYQAMTNDGVYDSCWSEENQNQISVACADGTVRLYDLLYERPVLLFKEHQAEVFSIHNNFIQKNLAVTASYDQTLKLWDMQIQSKTSLCTFVGHQYCVYQAVWHPQDPNFFMSASGDGFTNF